MPRLTRLDTSAELGTISDAQLAFLVAELQGDDEDRDGYFIDRETLELLSDNGADAELVAMLDKGMADDDEMTIVWE